MDDSLERDYSLGLPLAEFAFPGPLRDQLVDAILTGRKTSTTSLAREYQMNAEALPHRRQRFAVVDSSNHAVAIIEVTAVVVVPLGEVDLAHAVDEGEGHTTPAQWRAGHEAFWRSTAIFTTPSDTAFTLDDTTPVVLERFTLIERLS